jgi:hypothetical protein
MTPSAFRPRLTGLEDRTTPATPAGVFADLAAVQADAPILQQVVADPRVVWTAASQPLVRAVMSQVVTQADAATAELGDFLADLQARSAADPALAGFLAPFAERAAAALAEARVESVFARLFLQAAESPPAPAPTNGTGSTGTTGATGGLTSSGVMNGTTNPDGSITVQGANGPITVPGPSSGTTGITATNSGTR